MKNNLFKTLAAIVVAGTVALTAHSQVYVYGGISMAGGPISTDTGDLSTAMAITGFGNVIVIQGNGAYAGVPFLTPVTTTTGFTFLPNLSPDPTPDVWKFSWGGTDYSFQLDVIQSVSQGVEANNSKFLKISGLGTLNIEGYAPTAGSYLLTANSAETTVSFSAGNAAVPEPTSVALLLLGGVLALARRNR